MKKLLILTLLLIACKTGAQNGGETSYTFLELPVSARVAALGGDNISVIDDDVSIAMHNPSLLSSVSDRSLSFGYMNYLEGVNNISFAFAKIIRDRYKYDRASDRMTWGIAANYLNYGTISRRDEQDTDLGSFNAKDINIMPMFAYNLTDYWSGGVSGKMIYSTYDSYNSFALGVDLGLNYYHKQSDFSFSIAAKNLGGQLKSFENTTEKLPVNLQMGATKRLSHAPIAVSITASHLENWDDYSFADHFSFGADIFFGQNFFVAGGYNPRKASDMKVGDSSHGAGWSFGGGLHVKRIKVDAAYGKYHVAGGSLVMNVAYSL